MHQLLLSIALAIPTSAPQASQTAGAKDQEKMPLQKLDGTWTVTYAEADGKKLEGSGFKEVTIKDNVVTCKHDGKVKSWRLEFGPHNMVRCTETIDSKTTSNVPQDNRGEVGGKGQHTHHGVYIASPEYFCLAMNKGMDRRHSTAAAPARDGEKGAKQREGEPRANQTGHAHHFGDHGAHCSHFVIILQRSGTTTTSGAR
jgi:hypothetical protein